MHYIVRLTVRCAQAKVDALMIALLMLAIAAYGGFKLTQGGTISLYGIPHFSAGSNDSSVESHGLRLSILGVRPEKSHVAVRYALEWVRPRQNEQKMILMRPMAVVHVVFWDAHGREIMVADEQETESEKRNVQVFLGGFAVEGWMAYVHDDEVTVPLPENAHAVSMRMFRLHTGKVPIPTFDE
jgi:hypothetical protein